MSRVQTLASLLIDTLSLEFHDDLSPQWWEVFDLYSWQGVVPESSTGTRLRDELNKLCRCRSLNEISVLREFLVALKLALDKYKAHSEFARVSDSAKPTPEPGGVSASGSSTGWSMGLNRKCWEEAMVEAEAANGPHPSSRRCMHGTVASPIRPVTSDA